ncbi:MAG: iron-sulfur cluster assembly protein [Candidatus Woesearchaeota archaeon]|jgi:iron-sulfur cluster assembly protein
MTTLVDKDMTISEIVEKYPKTAEVFLEYGLHCVGCGVASFETLGEGAMSHGIDDETIDQMVRDANTVAGESQEEVDLDKNVVKVTTAAVERVLKLRQDDEGKAYFRIGVSEGGCSGMSYTFAIDKNRSVEDIYFEKDGLGIVMDKNAFSSLKGSTVDYVDTLQASGFKVYNPNAKATCGCGSSFA